MYLREIKSICKGVNHFRRGLREQKDKDTQLKLWLLGVALRASWCPSSSWEDLKHGKNGVVLPAGTGVRLQGQVWGTWLSFARLGTFDLGRGRGSLQMWCGSNRNQVILCCFLVTKWQQWKVRNFYTIHKQGLYSLQVIPVLVWPKAPGCCCEQREQLACEAWNQGL